MSRHEKSFGTVYRDFIEYLLFESTETTVKPNPSTGKNNPPLQYSKDTSKTYYAMVRGFGVDVDETAKKDSTGYSPHKYKKMPETVVIPDNIAFADNFNVPIPVKKINLKTGMGIDSSSLIKKIVLPRGTAEIMSFEGVPNLKVVEFPDGFVPSKVPLIIHNHALPENLEEMIIPKGTVLAKITRIDSGGGVSELDGVLYKSYKLSFKSILSFIRAGVWLNHELAQVSWNNTADKVVIVGNMLKQMQNGSYDKEDIAVCMGYLKGLLASISK